MQAYLDKVFQSPLIPVLLCLSLGAILLGVILRLACRALTDLPKSAAACFAILFIYVAAICSWGYDAHGNVMLNALPFIGELSDYNGVYQMLKTDFPAFFLEIVKLFLLAFTVNTLQDLIRFRKTKNVILWYLCQCIVVAAALFTIPAMNLALHALTAPGDAVIIQPPVYPPFRAVVTSTGRRVLENPLRVKDGRYEMDLEGLEALARRSEAKVFFLCSPHNPVGRVWTRRELQAAADICAANGVTVFSDEIHADFVHPGSVHIPFAALDGPAARECIVGTSASKSFNLAGLVTANIIVSDPDLRARLTGKVVGYTGEYTNYFGLAATRAAYEQGEPWLEALLEVIRGNYDYCKNFMAEKFPSVTVYPLEGTYLLWADFNSLGLEPAELERFMVEHQLYLDEGYLFGTGGAGFERINLACPRQCLTAAMERLDAAAAEFGFKR